MDKYKVLNILFYALVIATIILYIMFLIDLFCAAFDINFGFILPYVLQDQDYFTPSNSSIKYLPPNYNLDKKYLTYTTTVNNSSILGKPVSFEISFILERNIDSTIKFLYPDLKKNHLIDFFLYYIFIIPNWVSFFLLLESINIVSAYKTEDEKNNFKMQKEYTINYFNKLINSYYIFKKEYKTNMINIANRIDNPPNYTGKELKQFKLKYNLLNFDPEITPDKHKYYSKDLLNFIITYDKINDIYKNLILGVPQNLGSYEFNFTKTIPTVRYDTITYEFLNSLKLLNNNISIKNINTINFFKLNIIISKKYLLYHMIILNTDFTKIEFIYNQIEKRKNQTQNQTQNQTPVPVYNEKRYYEKFTLPYNIY